MKLSYNWLKEHLPQAPPAAEVAERLAQLGFEVAGLSRRGPSFTGVVTAKVLKVEKHPNADRLSLCTVTDGTRELSIVCGAPNVAAGQTVALAVVGAEVAGGKKITRAKIRGVESQGMICSASELGMEDGPKDGILVLEPGPLGEDFSRRFGPPDWIFDLEITPNRGDALSHRGIARELSGALGLPLLDRVQAGLSEAELAVPSISIEDAEGCPFYSGRSFEGLSVKPSPSWLVSKLESVGARSINNLVDITNFVLLDIGQPLHLFDLDRLAGPAVRVRRAKPGERLKALDDKDYELTAGCLVIADIDRPAALAGVIGGLESAVSEKTKRGFLESAYFTPAAVRRSAQALRIKTESSYRFERGCDPEAVLPASAYAASLILKLGGPNARVSKAAGAGKVPSRRRAITTTASRLSAVLGFSLSPEKIAQTLKPLSAGLKVDGEAVTFDPPSYRHDLETAWDLAEEVARVVGYEKIPEKPLIAPIAPAARDKKRSLIENLRDRLAGAGLSEAYNYDFISAKALEKSLWDPASDSLVRLANPLSQDWAVLRPTLFAGLLQNAVLNLSRGAESVRLFEIGKVYRKTSSGPEESWRASGVVFGPASETFWKASRRAGSDFYDVKGPLENLLPPAFGLTAGPLGDQAGPNDPAIHPAASLSWRSSHGPLACAGLLHPQVARRWELEGLSIALFDIDLERLGALSPAKLPISDPSPFPASRRDLSVVLDRSTPYASVEKAVLGLGLEELKKLELADVFEGQALGAGKKSLTLRLTFGRIERTITDDETNKAVERILAALAKECGAALRQ